MARTVEDYTNQALERYPDKIRELIKKKFDSLVGHDAVAGKLPDGMDKQEFDALYGMVLDRVINPDEV